MKRSHSLSIHALGMALTAAALLTALMTGARRVPLAARRALKPAALWWNAERFKASEEQVDYLRGTQRRLCKLALEAGRDAGYYARFRLDMSAEEHRELLLQRRLRTERERINQW